MFYRIILVAAIAVSMSGATRAFADVNMQDGMWVMTMKTDMPGMPFEMPPVKYSQCMTKKDLVPQKKEKNEDCKMISTKIDGNTVYWKAQCRTKDGTMDSDGKITYSGNSFNGTVKTIMNDKKSGRMEVTNHMTGKRVGDCK